MNKEDLQCLVGKCLNGYKIVKVENDPFIPGQINLWTNEYKTDTFRDRSIIKFFVRSESNSSKVYQELIDKEKYELKKTLADIKQYINETSYNFDYNGNHCELKNNVHCKRILQIIDKGLGELEQ